MYGSVLQQLISHRKEFISALKAARRKPSQKRIHRLRVASRRLGALLSFTTRLYPLLDKRAAKTARLLRKLRKGTGSLRDIQVSLRYLKKLPRAEQTLEAALPALSREVRAARRRVAKRLTRVRVKEVRRLLTRYERRFEGVCEASPPLRSSLRLVVKGLVSEVVALEPDSLGTGDEADHSFRLAVKTLRYQARALPELFKLPGAFSQKLEVLHGVLGRVRDINGLRVRLQGSPSTPERKELEDLLVKHLFWLYQRAQAHRLNLIGRQKRGRTGGRGSTYQGTLSESVPGALYATIN